MSGAAASESAVRTALRMLPSRESAAAGAASSALAAVRRAVVACQRCPRLRRYCLAVARSRKRAFRDQEYWGKPVPGFGDPAARLLVVGLAPAAHGGNRTGRVFTGDPSGDWLFEALHRFGFASQPHSVSRVDGMALAGCYIAAAVRCAPPANRPTLREQNTCRRYLTSECRALHDVVVVVALGRLAHDAWLKAAGWWDRLPPRARPRFFHAAEAPLPDGMTLISSYHPSRRNTNTGTLTRAMWHRIFRRAREIAAEVAPESAVRTALRTLPPRESAAAGARNAR